MMRFLGGLAMALAMTAGTLAPSVLLLAKYYVAAAALAIVYGVTLFAIVAIINR